MRLDVFLAENYSEYTRSKISDLIKRGFVTVNDKTVTKPGYEVIGTEDVKIVKEDIYASRAGEKLAHAIEIFSLNFKDLTVIDVGASTGGFTDVSLKNGAKHVFAYDVGTMQLLERLKNDERVTSLENTNILDVMVPENDICVIDVSFTSVLPILDHLKEQTNEIVFLLKPQFEATKDALNKKGVLKDQKVLSRIIEKTTKFITTIGYEVKGFTKSPIKGKEGNEEFLFYIRRRM
ncbi:TlyA family RNA methyltransferase [Acholeplasma hippikon]|uniref:Hemolysin n=1 Tax=Acholeplasma hippikon TaxID=264636 RepID=A0A449BIB1_9MOLU|nr:TlyA family RNA methyltransferase [Acholeplasma hippikon]VEU82178.1 Hemolysin [Acholeplasma hippikon]